MAHPAHLFRLPLVWSAGGSYRMACYSILYDVRDYVHVSSNPFNNASLYQSRIQIHIYLRGGGNIWFAYTLWKKRIPEGIFLKGFSSSQTFWVPVRKCIWLCFGYVIEFVYVDSGNCRPVQVFVSRYKKLYLKSICI